MNTKSVYIHSAAISRNVSNQVLKDGSSVLVRIISQKGDNLYEGSVFGKRVNIKTLQSIKIGSVFTAKVSIQNGKINLNPINSPENTNNQIQILNLRNFDINSAFSKIQNPEIQNLLISLNLVPDNLSLHIVLQMKQLGIKMDSAIIKKIYNFAAKYENKEEKVSELLTLLFQKKIDFNKENVDYFIERIDKNIPKKNKSEHINIDKEKIIEIINQFVKEVFGDACNKEINLLTIMNHKGFSDDDATANWVVIPYEILEDKEEIIGEGSVRFLFYEKTVKKMTVNCKMKSKEYNFLVEMNNTDKKNVKKILLNINPEKNYNEINQKIETLKRNFPFADILFVEKERIENNAVNSEEITLVRGLK